MPIGVGTIGGRPCHQSLNKILIETNDEKVTHVIMHRWNEVKTGIAKIEKYLLQADDSFFQSMLGLFRDSQLRAVDAMQGNIIDDLYTHFRCCVVGEFRDSFRKLKEKRDAEKAVRRSKAAERRRERRANQGLL